MTIAGRDARVDSYRWTSLARLEEIFQKLLENPLTNGLKYGIIYTVKGKPTNNYIREVRAMFRVWMIFDSGRYVYGTYESSNKANEVAMQVRDERGCDVYVEEIAP